MEFEDVLSRMLQAPIVDASGRDPDHAGKTFDNLIFVAMDYWQLSDMMLRCSPLVSRSGSSSAYVFDAFYRRIKHRVHRYPEFLRSAFVRFRPVEIMKTVPKLRHLFIPMNLLVDEQREFFQTDVRFIPIGVDALAFGTDDPRRHIDVNGYGRQPPYISNHLSDTLNQRGLGTTYHHTDHMHIAYINDPTRHRRHFWKTLTSSRIALAYAPEAYDPSGRFECSFVGQRYFECAAAGCMMMGKRPSAPEAAELLDWEDAVIDLPDDPAEAAHAIHVVLGDAERLRAASNRNYQNCLKKHDWRHRVLQMAQTIGLARGDQFRRELERLS